MYLEELFFNARRLRSLKRCNNYPTLLPEDVSQHSYYVALLAKTLYTDLKPKYREKIDLGTLLSKALVHDLEEAFISDIPYTVKHYSPSFNSELKKVTNEIMDGIIGEDEKSKALEKERRLSKAGLEGAIISFLDMLELGVYCYEEEKLGNTGVDTIYDNCCRYLPDLLLILVKALIRPETEDPREIRLIAGKEFPSIYRIYATVVNRNYLSDVGNLV